MVVAAQWLGNGVMPSQIATALRASAPGRYVMDLPTRDRRVGFDESEQQLPEQLIVEIAPPEADLVALATKLLRDAPRLDGRCVLCDEGERMGHTDTCVVAEARRTLALLAQEEIEERSRRRRR